MFVYLDIKQVTNAVGVALGPGPQVFIWETVKGLLLGTSLNSLAIGGFLNEGGLRETMFVHNGGASDGILGWFKGEPFSSSPASVIPAEAATFTSVGINSTNLGTSIRGLIKLAMSFQGQQTDDVDSWVKTQIGIDLGDVFRGLGGRFHLFSTGTVANLENPFEDQNFVLELKDEAPFRQLINKAAEMSGGGWQPKKYLERDIYSVGGSPQEGGPSFCIADRFFLFAGAVEKVEKLIRRLGKDAQGVGENEEYKKMAGSIPQKVNLLSFSNSKYLATYLESITEVLKDSVNDEVPEEVFLLLTAVGKTLGASIGYGVWQDAGLYFESTITYQKN
jgi:hypothetical protein